MGGIEPNIDDDPFERIEEYKIVLQELQQIKLRRQNNNNVFVGLNTVILTGIGAFLVSTRSLSWWIVAGVGLVALIVIPLNLMWRAVLITTNRQSDFGHDYLREIEDEFRRRRSDENNEHPVGFFLRVKEAGLRGLGSTRYEMRLATYFVVLYPLLVLILAMAAYLLHLGMVK